MIGSLVLLSIWFIKDVWFPPGRIKYSYSDYWDKFIKKWGKKINEDMAGNFYWNRCLTARFKWAENLYYLLHRWVGRWCPGTEESCRLLNEVIWLKVIWKLMLACVLNTVQCSDNIKNWKIILALNPLVFLWSGNLLNAEFCFSISLWYLNIKNESAENPCNYWKCSSFRNLW